MFSQPPPKRKNYGLRVLAGSAVGLVIGFGLCTAGAMNGGPSGDVFMKASAVAYAFSALGLLVGIVWAIATAIQNSRPN